MDLSASFQIDLQTLSFGNSSMAWLPTPDPNDATKFHLISSFVNTNAPGAKYLIENFSSNTSIVYLNQLSEGNQFQLWTMVPIVGVSNTFQLVNVGSGLCLWTAPGQSNSISTTTSNPTDGFQQWKLTLWS